MDSPIKYIDFWILSFVFIIGYSVLYEKNSDEILFPFKTHKYSHEYKIPFTTLHKQPDHITCGPTSVLMILQKYGKVISLDTVKSITNTVWFQYNTSDIGMTIRSISVGGSKLPPGGFWNDTPLYLFYECTGYTNGSECGRELNTQGWYYELLQAHNFNIYCMYLAMDVKETYPDYDDKQLKAYIMWNVERTFRYGRISRS